MPKIVGATDKLRITRTVTLVQLVPVNENYYPGMTPEQASAYEAGLDLVEKLEQFSEALLSGAEPQLSEEIVIVLKEDD